MVLDYQRSQDIKIMGNFRQDEAIWSLGVAAVLALSDLNPEEDFDQIPSLPRFDARVGLSFENQDMPMTFGPFNTFLIPGITVEYGDTTDYRGKRNCSIILSVARLIDQAYEREMVKLGQLCEKLYRLIFVNKTCPIYGFQDNDDVIIAIKGRLYWNDELNRLSPPSERMVDGSDVGGWLRNEYRFQVSFTIDGGPL